MRGYVSRVVSPEEYASLSDDELFEIIKNELYVNEAVADSQFKHKKLAEYLERALYVCPYCGLSTFESHNDVVKCKKCEREIRYLPTKELEGVGFEFPFRFVAEWYDYQVDFVNALNVLEYDEAPMYTESADLYEVTPCKRKDLIAERMQISLYGNRVEWVTADGKTVSTFEDISSIAVLGRNKLNVYCASKVYQLKGGKRFNALKYVNMYHRYKNIVKGDVYGKFLGL